MKRRTLLVLSLLLVVIGSTLLSFRRCVYGNQLLEQRITRCTVEENAEISVYEGNAGATTAYWYSVTADFGLFAAEKQFLFTYGIPVVDSVECSTTSVAVTLNDGVENHVLEFSLAEIEGYFRDGPLAWRMGEKLAREGWPVPILRVVGFTAIAVAILLLIVPLFPRSRRSTR